MVGVKSTTNTHTPPTGRNILQKFNNSVTLIINFSLVTAVGTGVMN